MIIFYIFCFSTWALGLLSWVIFIGKSISDWELVYQTKKLELQLAQFQLKKMGLFNPLLENKFQSDIPNKEEIPEKIKQLMKSSPAHPEVSEIDSSDKILGVRFEAENYPPGFAPDDDD